MEPLVESVVGLPRHSDQRLSNERPQITLPRPRLHDWQAPYPLGTDQLRPSAHRRSRGCLIAIDECRLVFQYQNKGTYIPT